MQPIGAGPRKAQKERPFDHIPTYPHVVVHPQDTIYPVQEPEVGLNEMFLRNVTGDRNLTVIDAPIEASLHWRS